MTQSRCSQVQCADSVKTLGGLGERLPRFVGLELEVIAVGNLAFVEKISGELGVKALHRKVEHLDGTYALREPGEAYKTILTSISQTREKVFLFSYC